MARNKIQNEDDLWIENVLVEVDVRLTGKEIEKEKYEVDTLNRKAFTSNDFENKTEVLQENMDNELDNDKAIQQNTKFLDAIFTCFIFIVFIFACIVIYKHFLDL